MKKKRPKILFVEDDKVDRMAFERSARLEGYPFDYDLASSIGDAASRIKDGNYTAVVSDYMLGDGTALDLFRVVDNIPVIIVTGAGDEEIAVRAMKEGAYDYLIKDPDYHYLKTLPMTVRNAISRKITEDELVRHKEHLEELVQLRTAELRREIDERKKAEEEKIKAFIEARNLEKEIMQITERERQRIGQDLHDGLGQNLTAVSFLIEALREKMMKGMKIEVEDLDNVNRFVRDSIVQTKSIARVLCPVEMDKNGLIAAIEEMATATEKIYKITCRVSQEGNFFLNDNQVATHLFYIAREAVTNAINHGRAGLITLRLISDSKGISMVIKDNGSGADESKKGSGMGLRIMQYRAGVIGADFYAGNHREGGFEVSIILGNENK